MGGMLQPGKKKRHFGSLFLAHSAMHPIPTRIRIWSPFWHNCAHCIFLFFSFFFFCLCLLCSSDIDFNTSKLAFYKKALVLLPPLYSYLQSQGMASGYRLGPLPPPSNLNWSYWVCIQTKNKNNNLLQNYKSWSVYHSLFFDISRTSCHIWTSLVENSCIHPAVSHSRLNFALFL